MKFEKIRSEELKRRLRARKISGLALDIDDTLSHTDQHWFNQVNMRLGNPENMTFRETAKKYGREERIPHWQTQKGKRLVKKLIHSNKFQVDISLIAGSNRAVQKINRIIPIVAYLSSRPSSVWAGTRQWLSKHGFPDAPIILLPSNVAHHKGIEWKARRIKFLYPEVQGIIDDHPALQKELKTIGYLGRLFMYDSGGNAHHYHPRVARFRSWSDILKEIKNFAK